MKKLFYLTIVFSGLMLFSCASTPKNIDRTDITQTENENINENSETEGETQAEGQTEGEDETQSEGQNEGEEGESSDDDMTEKVEDEELPELPPLPDEEDQETENLPVIPEEPDVPVVSEENEGKNGTGATGSKSGEAGDGVTVTEGDGTETSDSDENAGNETGLENQDENSEASDEDGSGTEEDVDEESEEDNSDEGDGDSDLEADEDEEAEEEEVIVPSRTLVVPKNQLIDITYPGKGWIYQGCIDEEGEVDVRNRYFVFSGRRLGGENTTFTLRSRNAGKYLLHFYKNDSLSGTYIDDYLLIEVTQTVSQNQNHVKAPDYAVLVPPKPTITAETLKQKKIEEEKKKQEASADSGTQSEEADKPLKRSNSSGNESRIENINSASEKEENDGSALKTVIQDSDEKAAEGSSYSKATQGITQNQDNLSFEGEEEQEDEDSLVEEINYSPDELLKEANSAYDSKKYREALSLVDKFLEIAVSRIDEGLFLKGKTLETKSQVQNIKEAVRIYDLLLENYPQSFLWEDAKKRSIFLKRFYINIR